MLLPSLSSQTNTYEDLNSDEIFQESSQAIFISGEIGSQDQNTGILSKFSEKYFKDYLEKSRKIDTASAITLKEAFETKDIETEAENIKKMQNHDLQEASTKKLNETEEKGFFFSDRRAMIFKITATNKVFPLHVVIESRLDDIETFISRWDSKPSPQKHEARFISKDFRVTFNEEETEHKCSNVFMTIILRKIAHVRVKIMWAGEIKEGKREEKNGEKEMSLKEFKKSKTTKKNTIEEIKDYINFYQKVFIGKEKKSFLSKKSKGKILQNILNQAKFFKNKKGQLPLLVD